MSHNSEEGYLAYRGQHCGEGGIRSKLPSISFGTMKVAHDYATSPNNRGDVAVSPKVFEVLLRIDNPFVDQVGDGMIDVEDLVDKLGLYSIPFVGRYAGGQDYVQLWRLFDDPEFIDVISDLGYDGAIYMGSGAGACTPEYRVLRRDQISVRKVNTIEG